MKASLIRFILSGVLLLCASGQTRLGIRQAGDSTSVPETSRSPHEADGIRLAGAPVLGYVPGEAPNEIHSLLGIPGSARFGPLIRFPEEVSQVLLPPRRSYAVLVGKEHLSIAQLNEAPTRISSLTAKHRSVGEPSAPEGSPMQRLDSCVDSYAFSPSGETLAMYCQSKELITTVVGLPGPPTRIVELSASSHQQGPIRLLAVSDDATALIAADAVGAPYCLAINGTLERLSVEGQVSAAAFVGGSHTAVFSTKEPELLYLLKDKGPPLRMADLSAESHNPGGADFVVVIGGRALATNPKSQQLWSFDLTSETYRSLKLSITPRGMAVLSGQRLYCFAGGSSSDSRIVEFSHDGELMEFTIPRPTPRGERPRSPF